MLSYHKAHDLERLISFISSGSSCGFFCGSFCGSYGSYCGSSDSSCGSTCSSCGSLRPPLSATSHTFIWDSFCTFLASRAYPKKIKSTICLILIFLLLKIECPKCITPLFPFMCNSLLTQSPIRHYINSESVK